MSAKSRIYLVLIGLFLITPILLAINYPYPDVQTPLEVFMVVLAYEVLGWGFITSFFLLAFALIETYKSLKRK